jgi:hypothetical protein
MDRPLDSLPPASPPPELPPRRAAQALMRTEIENAKKREPSPAKPSEKLAISTGKLTPLGALGMLTTDLISKMIGTLNCPSVGILLLGSKAIHSRVSLRLLNDQGRQLALTLPPMDVFQDPNNRDKRWIPIDRAGIRALKEGTINFEPSTGLQVVDETLPPKEAMQSNPKLNFGPNIRKQVVDGVLPFKEAQQRVSNPKEAWVNLKEEFEASAFYRANQERVNLPRPNYYMVQKYLNKALGIEDPAAIAWLTLRDNYLNPETMGLLLDGSLSMKDLLDVTARDGDREPFLAVVARFKEDIDLGKIAIKDLLPACGGSSRLTVVLGEPRIGELLETGAFSHAELREAVFTDMDISQYDSKKRTITDMLKDELIQDLLEQRKVTLQQLREISAEKKCEFITNRFIRADIQEGKLTIDDWMQQPVQVPKNSRSIQPEQPPKQETCIIS